VVASEEAIDDAIATMRLLARSVAEPELPRGLVDGDAAEERHGLWSAVPPVRRL
jgi:hypothetical protein